MPISNFSTYNNYIKNEIESQYYIISGNAAAVGKSSNTWALGLPVPATPPTTAIAPSLTSNTAFPLPAVSGTRRLKLVGANITSYFTNGYFLLVDILSHQGGLSGTVTTAQTTNLPTAALTRYTNGVGVMIGLTIYTQIGATTTKVSASYTNQAGTSGRTTPLTTIGNTGYREATRMIMLPLQYGDTGVRAVASVTLSATTGTAGAFGVTLFKPLGVFAVDEVGRSNDCDFVTGRMPCGIPDVTGACLALVQINGSNATATTIMKVQVVETDN